MTAAAAALEPIRLGSWPTPLDRAPRLAEAIGLDPADLWLKRDDVMGLGAGGNKIRKLEYTCADAVRSGATVLVTSGAAQSNHARLTAAAAARLGLGCVLVLAGEAPPTAQGNLVLDQLAGATLVWAGDGAGSRLQERVATESRAVEERGGSPYVVPFGGSSPLSAQGYVDAGAELEAQLEGIDQVVVAVGSGGTMAGLVAHLGADRVVGFDTGAVPDATATVGAILDGMPISPDRLVGLEIHRDQVGAGYHELTSGAQEAMILAARTEGLFIDPVYTARALSGLVELVRTGRIRRGRRTVFMVTGGLPGLFGHPQLADLLS